MHDSSCDEAVNVKAEESLADKDFNVVMAALSSPVAALQSRSSRSTVSSSRTSFESHTRNKFSPSLQESLNSKRTMQVKDGKINKRSSEFPGTDHILLIRLVGGDDSTTTKRGDLQDKSDDHLFEDNIREGLESRLFGSLELTAEASSLIIPALDILLLVKDVTRNSEDDFVTFPVK
ncbi:hypothetical protein Bca52824_000585 [Brassica carinata]|uniref:Uncharacterized protein n=1 Tax=Brassica carinata TaxID=52824 RepID=A0A8X7WHQ0_BRACI|nr:hypothetical protein Bca52824_000585 [Brassica carinata]